MRANSFLVSAVLLIFCFAAAPAFAAWSTSVVLPYNAPAYVAQWESDNEVVVFTMTNRSDAPAPIMLQLVVTNEAGEEIFHGTSVPFLMPNNNPRAVRTPDLIRWKQIVWNPLFRRAYANPGRLPEGDINVCVQVYEWKNGKGEKLSEACGKTFVNYPDIPKLTKPADDAHLSAIPTFAWQRPDIPENVSLHYALKIAEMTNGATPDAALQEKSAYSVDVNGTSYALSPDAYQLKYGVNYAWRVTALDQYGNAATSHGGQSRAGKFSFDPINESQKLRIVTILKKNATDLLTAALSQGDAATLAFAKTAKDKIMGATLPQSFDDIAKTLSAGIDSLGHANATPALINNVIGAQFAVSYAGDLSGARFPLAGSTADSLLAVCIARAKGLRSAATGMEIAPADSLVHRLTTLRAGMGLQHSDLVTVVENFNWLNTSKESDLQAALLASVEESFTAFLHQVWKAGAYLADVVSQSHSVQAHTPKNSQAAVSDIADKSLAAMKQLAAGSGSAAGMISNLGEGIESLRHMKGMKGEELSAITNNLDGMQSDVASCLKSISGASSSSGAPAASIADALSKISVSKKGTKDLNRAIETCTQAGPDASSQSTAMEEARKTVQSLMKSEKEKDALQAVANRIAELQSTYAQGSIYNDAAEMSNSVSRSIKDPKATAVCKAITDNCHADATDAATHPFSPAEAVRRAQNIIRDAKTLDETFPGNTSLAASVQPMLEEKVIVPNLLNDPSMDDIKAMMAQKGATNVAFGATNDNAFAQMDGGTVTINATLGDEPPAVLKYFIALALNSGGASTLEGMYAQNELTGTLLLKSGGNRMNTRADISIDMKTLGEQESKRLLHAMPAYANTADH